VTYREQFLAIMNYEDNHTMPVVHWTGWEETLERWYGEGLPRDVDQHEFFGTKPMWGWASANLGLLPAFDEEVIEETEEYRIFRGGDGVVCKDWKGKSCIPHFIDFTLKSAADWPAYKERLQPHPDRIPKDLPRLAADLEACGLPLCVNTASLMGWIRNWMGVENMSYLMFDDRDVYADMVDTISDLVCWSCDIILPYVKVDMGFGWEDICGKSGPLVSPAIFDKCVAPGYRKIRNKLEEYGVKLYGIDSDGDVTDLVGHWLDAGVNLQFPIEVGSWNGDAMAFRKKYGRELRIVGNFDKRALEKSHAAIDAELERLMPLMRDGGYLLLPDHLITPDTALDDYRWYLDRVRQLRF
jgi:uroporphyrinogen decarboxylase